MDERAFQFKAGQPVPAGDLLHRLPTMSPVGPDCQDTATIFPDGRENVQGLLSQWNYWCAYMNHGPENLPSPPLFFSENEDARESFLFCTYSFGFQTTSFTRTLLMPLIVFLTGFRLIALWTCRDPIWPMAVQAVSAIAAGDRYDEPRGRTAVGWVETGVSAECDEWPFAPTAATTHWHGEVDAATNARLWTKDTAPAALSPSGQSGQAV